MSSSPKESPRRTRKDNGLKMKYSDISLTNELYDNFQAKTYSSADRKNRFIKQSSSKSHSLNQNGLGHSSSSVQNGNTNYSHKCEQIFKKGSVSQLKNVASANSSSYSLSDVSGAKNKDNINVSSCFANKRTRKLTDSNSCESLFSLPKLNNKINNSSTTFCQCQSLHSDLKQPAAQIHLKSSGQVYEKENLLAFQRSNHSYYVKHDARSDEKKCSVSSIESHHNCKKDDYLSRSHHLLRQRDSISSTASGGETQNLRCEQSSTSVSPCRPCCQGHPNCTFSHNVSEPSHLQFIMDDKECRTRYDSNTNPSIFTDKRHMAQVNIAPHSKNHSMSNSLVQTKKEIQFFKEIAPSVNDVSTPNDMIQPAFVFGKHQRSINACNEGSRDRYLKDLKQLEKKLILKGKKKNSDNTAHLVQHPSVNLKEKKQQCTSHSSAECHSDNYRKSLKNLHLMYSTSPSFLHGAYTHAIDSNSLSMKQENEELKTTIRHLTRKIAVLEAHMERDEVVIASSQNRLKHIQSYLLEIQPNYPATSPFGYHLKRLLSYLVAPSDSNHIKSFDTNMSYDKVIEEPRVTSLLKMEKRTKVNRKNKMGEFTENFFKHHHMEPVHFQPTHSFTKNDLLFSVSSDPDSSPLKCQPEQRASHSPDKKESIDSFNIRKKHLRKNTSRPPNVSRCDEEKISNESHSEGLKEEQTIGQPTTGVKGYKNDLISSNIESNDIVYDKSLNNAPCRTATTDNSDSNTFSCDIKYEPKQKKKPFVPLLGLQKKNVGFGAWLSGQPTQGDTYNTALHTIQSN